MGASFSSLAIKGGSRDQVLALLGLRGTNVFEEIPESEITGVALPTGWFLIIANGSNLAFEADPALKKLSHSMEILTGFVEEHVMCSSTSLWANGQQIWLTKHDAQQNIEHLDTKGHLPSIFTSIQTRLRAKQEAAGGPQANVDYIFDIPVEIFAHLTGYRYDRDTPGLSARAFEVLAITESKPKRSWLQRIFGV